MNDLLSGQPDPPEYNAASIEVLEDMEHVRLRPGMYIGGTDDRAFHHLVIAPDLIRVSLAGGDHWLCHQMPEAILRWVAE